MTRQLGLALGLLAVGLLALPVAEAHPREGVVGRFKSAAKPAQKGKPMSIAQAYPTYHPEKYDPDLADVKRGRRIVPKNDILLTEGGYSSIQELIEHALNCVSIGSGKQLAQCTVSYKDFCNICWPEFPQSRPAANVPALSAWEVLHHKNVSAFNRNCGDWAGKGITLKDFKVGPVVEYTNFRLYPDIQITVTEATTGEPQDFYMIRTIMERDGVFKIYGTRD